MARPSKSDETRGVAASARSHGSRAEVARASSGLREVGSRPSARELARLAREIRACRLCHEAPHGQKLAHEPRPIFRVDPNAPIGIFSQAPGIRAHDADVPFMDPSGVRLREWLGVDEATFYDPAKFVIAPMGFCFPGHDAKGGDRPPRRECAPAWREELMARLGGLRLVLLVGSYAQRWHLGDAASRTLTETVKNWRHIVELSENSKGVPVYVPLPHPSWRNNAWIKANPFFERDLLPDLQRRVAALV